MPELPEVETLRRSLESRILNRRVVGGTLYRRDVLILPGDPTGGFSRSRTASPPMRFRSSHLLVGGTIIELRRHGKQLALIADDGRVLVVHLGMSGQIRHTAEDAPGLAHLHVLWKLDDGSRMAFIDPRRFGGLWYFPSFDHLKAERWSQLGPDGLTISEADLAAAISGSHRPIKALLLDQASIAGVGNIYADESLFLAGIRPQKIAARLSPEQIARLAGAIREILGRAVEARGSTLRNYADAAGQPGTAQDAHKVYGRAGEPCTACGRPLKGLILAQRSTVFCPRCQR